MTTPSTNPDSDEQSQATPALESRPKPAPTEEKPQPLFPEPAVPEEPEEVILDMASLDSDEEYSPEERERLESKYMETMRDFRSGELVEGKIVAITDSDVAVDIGFKSEGSIPLEEFDKPDELKVGDQIEVLIDNVESSEGTVALSKRKAVFTRVWEKINDLYLTGEMVEAQIIRRIKGGMVVDLFGIEAFLPGSQIDVHPIRDFDALVGANMDFRIIKVNNQRKNVVLSHKVLVEESLREIRAKVLAELEEGQVVEGVVKNITDFGVFVDLGGVDGLLHITDLSWGRVSHPSDIVKLDEKIKVKVLNYDKERQRISLGLKQLKEHLWDNIEEKLAVGAKVKGKVMSLMRYGAFIEIEEGVEGLVHVSEMSWTQHIKHPSQMLNVGDVIDVVILNIDKESRKISLGIKQTEEDPWERLESFFLPGTVHKGMVRDLVPFGAFVELEPGIDGLIHISDLSWTRKIRHPSEVVKKGDTTDVVILNFDRNERRIALGLKQLEPDPWDGFEREYVIRTRTTATVHRVLEKGVVVMLPTGVEGFIPNSQLGKDYAGDARKDLKEEEEIELEVIEFDRVNHRIVLSHSAVEKTREKAEDHEYQDVAPPPSKATLGDLMPETVVTTETAPVEETVEPEPPPEVAPEAPPEAPPEAEPAQVEEEEAKAAKPARARKSKKAEEAGEDEGKAKKPKAKKARAAAEPEESTPAEESGQEGGESSTEEEKNKEE